MNLLFHKKRLSVSLWTVLGLFFFWRILITIYLILSVKFLPVFSADKFLGGTYKNYELSPFVFSWANFDGEHYLSIAIFGYKSLQQAFFPVYPILIAFFTNLLSNDYFSKIIWGILSGVFISNVFFLLSLIILWDLVRLDYSKKIAFFTLLLLVLFPTSFYFGAVYSESLFLFLTLTSFYFARKDRWLFSSIFGLLSSATRVFGVLLLPSLIIEAILQKKPLKQVFWIMLIPVGLILYMYYLWQTTGDAVAFYTLQRIIGDQHQPGVYLLPQVYFRYVKMIFDLSWDNFFSLTVLLEAVTGTAFFILPIYGLFKKVRPSYLFYAFFSFIIPTLQGSFSSTPRYVLVIFPSFIILSLLLSSASFIIRSIYLLISLIWFSISTMLFLRGYFIA